VLRKKKKVIFFFVTCEGWEFVSGGWSPHMDYPGDSVITRVSTLVDYFGAKNAFWFRYVLTENDLSIEQIVRYSLFSHVVG
jgi:hypothetical protein